MKTTTAVLALLLAACTTTVTFGQIALEEHYAPVMNFSSDGAAESTAVEAQQVGELPDNLNWQSNTAEGGIVFPTEIYTDAIAGDAGKEGKKKEQQDEAKKKKQAKAEKEKQEQLKKSAAGAYKGLFYDNDFGFLDDPDYTGYFLGDRLKRIHFGTCACSSSGSGLCSQGSGACKCGKGIVLDIGGQYRFRFHGEQNIRGLGLTGRDDQFLLQRTRLFFNLRLGERFRFYAEYLDAVSQYEEFLPRPIEENRSDFINLFVDGTIFETEQGKLMGRIGRQELLYGAQRAVSPLDWANTRRPFDGGKLMWKGKHLDVDGFWMRPLPPNTREFDNPLLDLQFYGIYSSYKDIEDAKVEGYWLAFDNDLTGVRVDSIGGRYYKESENLLFEMWGNYQFGVNADNSSHSGGAWTVGLGHKFDCAWNPTVWAYYDWASGDQPQGAGNGYFQFLPLAHKYLGFMDLFGRRNIESPNVQLSVQPTKKLKLLAWYHYLFLEDRRDTPYSVAMTPFFPGVTPGSADLGHEIDLLAACKLSPRSALLLGYSHFFSGDYYDTPGLPYSGDADFFYTQYHFNF